jgi:hypothetical protein
MTTAHPPTNDPVGLVCPPWCDNHSDWAYGGKLVIHYARDLEFQTGRDGVLRVGLVGTLHPDGTPGPDGEWPPLLDLNGPTFTAAQIRQVAAALLNLADVAEHPMRGEPA